MEEEKERVWGVAPWAAAEAVGEVAAYGSSGGAILTPALSRGAAGTEVDRDREVGCRGESGAWRLGSRPLIHGGCVFKGKRFQFLDYKMIART